MKKHRKNNQRGFTLIETGVAISVLLVAVAAPLVIAQRGLKTSQIAKEEITAFYLAQESFEFIKTLRDTNTFTGGGNNWLNGLNNCINRDCYIDTVTGSVTQCSGDCPALRYDETTGIYGYNSGIDTGFVRTIYIDDTIDGASNNEVAIDVTLSWPSGLTTETYTARQNLLNFLDATILGGGGSPPVTNEIIITNISTDYERGSPVSSLSWQHEIGDDDDKFVFVAISYENAGSSYVSDVEFNGQNMLPLDSVDSASGPGLYTLDTWYILDSSLPSSAGTYNIDVTFSGGSPSEVNFGAVTYANVEQQAPTDSGTYTENGFIKEERLFTVDVAEDNSVVIEVMAGHNAWNAYGTHQDQIYTFQEWRAGEAQVAVAHTFVGQNGNGKGSRWFVESANPASYSPALDSGTVGFTRAYYTIAPESTP